MTLGDKETLELNELCGALVDGTITEQQRTRLTAMLRESEAARRYYVRALGQSASLHDYAAEMHADAPETPRRVAPIVRFPRWWLAAVPAAAAIALGLFWVFGPGSLTDEAATAQPSQFVARLTAAKDLQWAGASLAPGAHLRKGQRLELARGFAEVTFDSGARVVLEGAASLELNSAWDATLRRGTLKANVPPQAIGFRISNPAVEVVDLGTEFTMIADGHSAEVLVLKGEVEAAPRTAQAQETILLRERESRRFAASGVSDVSDFESKFARFTQPLELDRLTPATRYVHWSFDEASGSALMAETPGTGAASLAGKIVGSDASAAHAEGVRGRALRFEGSAYAQAPLPGISSNTPHTIAFWVRVPEDASLSDAYSMVTWATRNKKLRNRHVGINWNRDRADGPIGALRTDFGGGQAVGSTSLRDGKWHYITVCFAPGDEDPQIPVQVKLYVDSRLESSTVIPGRTRGPLVTENESFADTVYLGCRLGSSGPMQQRFRGEIDELVVVDRGLEPNEIVALMKTNRLPSGTMLAEASR